MSYLGTKPANQVIDSTLIANGAITADDIANGAITRAKMGYAGAVLQVVQTYYKTTETINTSTFTATGLSASITPISTTSKILVQVSISTSSQTDTYGGFRLYRNNAEITAANSNQATGSNANLFITYAHRDGDASYELDTFCQTYLDSPASTSAQTYTIYWARLYGGIMKINGPYTVDTGNTYTNFAPSNITLMEIAA